ncbi:MAG: RNA methyltransferase [Patescibacteria group bacterium]|jgi:TrmH family RNA methyltransferase
MTISDYQIITSLQNNQIKLLEKLNSKKYRQESKKFVVENLAIILDALKDKHDFIALFITEDFANKHTLELEYLQNNSQNKNFYLIDQKLNKHYSNLDTPSGITAIYNTKVQKLDKTSVVYLNGISDPGNIGAIMRSALAFGFVNLVLGKNCVDLYNHKVISAAKDTIFKLNIIEDKAGDWLRDNKLVIYTADAHLGVDIAKFKPAKAFCLVLGSESHGINSEISKLAHKSLKIEISSKIESLNVAAAAAILFYELKNK